MASSDKVKNYQMVSPQSKQKLKGILNWARTKTRHPFTECKAALIKRGTPPERADGICGTMKDIALNRTTWRKGSKRAA